MKIHVRMGDEHKALYGIGFLLLIIVGFWYFTVYERPITNAQQFPDLRDATIVAFGDSLVRGVGAKSSGGFVGVLEQDLGIQVDNLGVSGDTTADAYNRVSQVIALDPDVVIISLGGNDFLQRKNKDDVIQNLERIISTIHRSGSSVILLEVPGYFGMHRTIAKDTGTGYVSNILSGLIGKDEYMFDSIHPNDAGYKKIALKIRPVLLKIIH